MAPLSVLLLVLLGEQQWKGRSLLFERQIAQLCVRQFETLFVQQVLVPVVQQALVPAVRQEQYSENSVRQRKAATL
jgi:hypothetical protein